jgi:hypothetical protein
MMEIMEFMYINIISLNQIFTLGKKKLDGHAQDLLYLMEEVAGMKNY